jgi:hypothetical protein
LPAGAAVLGLDPAFRQVSQQHGHPAGELAFFAFAHVFDLVGEMFDVEFGKASGAQEPRLLLRPEDHIFVISRPAVRPLPTRSRRVEAAPALLSLIAWPPGRLYPLAVSSRRGAQLGALE